jgi:hypothetical protein
MRKYLLNIVVDLYSFLPEKIINNIRHKLDSYILL